MSSEFPKPVETSMRTKLEKNLTPFHLEIINESYMHNVPKGSETHFKVVIVSDKFNNEALIQVIFFQLKKITKNHCFI